MVFKSNIKIIFLIIFRYLIVITFFVSFFSKLYSFSDFVNFIKFIFHLNNTLSLKLSVLILSIEFFVSTIILLKNSKFAYIIASILTFIFSIFLFVLTVINYKGNCYCFGTFIELSPFYTFLKNIIILFLLYFLYKNAEREISYFYKYFLLFITILTFFIVINEPRDFFREEPKSISIVEIVNFDKVLYIDARNKLAFKNHHIPSAINIPFSFRSKISSNTLTKINSTDVNVPIIVYCDNKICSLAKELTRRLTKIYPDRKFYYLLEGLEKWDRN